MKKKYRKKPVVVEAMQFTGDNWLEIQNWMEESGSKRLLIPEIDVNGKVMGILIKTLEGDMRANIGDYIIKGVNGEFYPCKPDIFAKTYEEVKE